MGQQMNLPSVLIAGHTPSRSSSWLQSSEVALQLITAAQARMTASDASAKSKQPAETGMEALLRYASQAQQLANPAVVPEILPEVVGGGFTETGWSRSEVLSLSDLAPEYAAEAAALGATRVVRRTPPAITDAEFQVKIASYLDEAYADDPAYLAARDAGAVTISRTADLGFSDEFGSFELYRGNEYFGGMGMGIPDPAFDAFWADQNAAGTYLMVGAVGGYGVVASWAAQATPTA